MLCGKMRVSVLLILTYLSCLDGLNVLVYSPAFGGSHTNFMAHLADTLTEAGHNVTFMVPVADEERKHQMGVKITKDVVIVEQDEEHRSQAIPLDESMEAFWTLRQSPAQIIELFYWFRRTTFLSCQNLLRNRQVLEDMKARNFDVAILEPVSVCGLGFFKMIGVEKTILATSCTQYDFIMKSIGEPFELSNVPSLTSEFSDKMSIYERYTNWKLAEASDNSIYELFDWELEELRKIDPTMPEWPDLFAHASLYFTNSNPYIDFPRPVLQKTVPIGGITVNMEKIKSQKVDKEWDEILSRRENNILISFGSMVKSHKMPREWRNNILEVIKSFPDVTFIWKYENNDHEWAKNASNLYLPTWAPQTALLADPRLSAFLTHGGLGSTNELAYCGKPAITVPIFGDQVRNAKMLTRHNGSIFLWKFELGDYERVRKAVHDILYDPMYKQNAESMAKLLENQPLKPKEMVVKYTEFVGNYGPFPTMDPQARHLTWIQRHLFDVYAILGVVYFSLLVISLYILKHFFSKIQISIVSKSKKVE